MTQKNDSVNISKVKVIDMLGAAAGNKTCHNAAA